MFYKIQIKRGLRATLPNLDIGELGLCTDTDEVFIGTSSGINKKIRETSSVDPRDFGAVLDGVTDDTIAIREAISYAESNGMNLFLAGIALITGEIEIKKTMVVHGIGSGRGYTSAGIAGYEQKSGFLVKGTGAKRIRTRRKHRASASDPQDAPLSVALNIQSENVSLKDISIFLDFDRGDNSPSNYGADWDVGVFVGCRTHFKTYNVHVMGYWREASIYYDVTHASNMPRFNDLSGTPYDNTFNVSGGDGCAMYKTMTWGGKWGIRIAGAIKDYSNNTYYDELQGALVSDFRGSFGFSDFTTYSCSIYGTDHHSMYRRDKATGNYLTDTAGGAMYADGHAGNANNSVWGHRHFSTRFASFEPYRVKLDRVARVQFYGCHIEYRSGTRYNQDGTTVAFDNTDSYGYVSGTANTDHVMLIGSNGGVIDSAFMPSTVRIHNLFPSGTSTGSSTTDKLIAGGFEAVSGNLDLRSAPSSYIQFRVGSSTIGYMNESVWRANSDNIIDLGSSGARFKNVYAGSGTINTSDRNKKQSIESIPDKVLDAWSDVNYQQFKFNDAVDEKGEEARFHVGIIAQEIEETFKKHGLNAFDYGILCYDEWDDIYEEVDGDMVLVTEKGSLYSIRSDECLMLESALMRRNTRRLEDKIKLLEEKLNM